MCLTHQHFEYVLKIESQIRNQIAKYLHRHHVGRILQLLHTRKVNSRLITLIAWRPLSHTHILTCVHRRRTHRICVKFHLSGISVYSTRYKIHEMQFAKWVESTRSHTRTLNANTYCYYLSSTFRRTLIKLRAKLKPNRTDVLPSDSSEHTWRHRIRALFSCHANRRRVGVSMKSSPISLTPSQVQWLSALQNGGDINILHIL